jgi:hypothetical protein
MEAQPTCSSPPETPPELIAGILHQGAKCSLAEDPKSFKSWSLIHLVCSGRPTWLKFKQANSCALFELELPFAIASRLSPSQRLSRLQSPA